MKHLLMVVVAICAGHLHAQSSLMPREKALLIGWHQCFDRHNPSAPTPPSGNWTTSFKVPTVALEKTLMLHGSIQFGLGADCFSHPRNPDYRKFNSQLFTEIRYYFLLHRGRPTSGIYMGLYADMIRERWIYRQGGNIAIRKSYENAGPSIGYQHAWGEHFRFNEGVTAVMQSTIRENRYEPTGGSPKSSQIVDQWYSFYWYFKMGVVF